MRARELERERGKHWDYRMLKKLQMLLQVFLIGGNIFEVLTDNLLGLIKCHCQERRKVIVLVLSVKSIPASPYSTRKEDGGSNKAWTGPRQGASKLVQTVAFSCKQATEGQFQRKIVDGCQCGKTQVMLPCGKPQRIEYGPCFLYPAMAVSKTLSKPRGTQYIAHAHAHTPPWPINPGSARKLNRSRKC